MFNHKSSIRNLEFCEVRHYLFTP